MNNIIYFINETAELWMLAMERAIIRGSILFIILIILSKIFSGLNFSFRDWLWKIAFIQLLIIVFWSFPVNITFSGIEASSLIQQTMKVCSSENCNIEECTIEEELLISEVFNYPAAKNLTNSQMSSDHFTKGFVDNNNLIFNNNIINQLSIVSYFLIIWLLGVICLLVYLTYFWKQSQKIIKSGRKLDNEKINQIYDNLATKINIKNKPKLLVSEKVKSPSLIGLLLPVIILPDTITQNYSDYEIKSILAHELAHRKRNDLLWNFIITICQIIFFFNPLIWLGKKEWSIARENACDYKAIKTTYISRANYSRILVNSVSSNSISQKDNQNFSIALMGAQSSFQIIKRRLQYIKRIKNKFDYKHIVISIVLAGLFLIPWQFSLITGADYSGRYNLVLFEQRTEIEFADSNLEKVIRDIIKKPRGPIFMEDVYYIEKIEAPRMGIQSLEGIQHLINLHTLNLGETYDNLIEMDDQEFIRLNEINKITDISPIAQLEKLEYLNLSTHNISDISSLSNLTNLKKLNIMVNYVSNIEALRELVHLEHFYFAGNRIEDLSPLGNLVLLCCCTTTKNLFGF